MALIIIEEFSYSFIKAFFGILIALESLDALVPKVFLYLINLFVF